MMNQELKKSWTKHKKLEESTPSMKLKFSLKDHTMRSNCNEWTKHVKDEIGKAGNSYKKQVHKMRFSPFNLAKEMNKLALKPEVPIQEDIWRALTQETDQVEIQAIEAGPVRTAKKSELFLKWTIETLERNAKIKENNIVNKAKLKQLPVLEKEREDTDAHLFYSILQLMEEDSRDTIESHIIIGYGKRYQPGKTVTGDDAATIPEGGIDDSDGGDGALGGGDVGDMYGDAGDDNSTLSGERTNADTGFSTAEQRNDWIWLLIAAEETHIIRIVGTDADELERCKEREDQALRAMRHTPGQQLISFSRLFKDQIKLCDKFKQKYTQQTLMRIYMDAMPKELYKLEKNEYRNQTLKYVFGNTLSSMIDEMHRRANRLAGEEPSIYYNFINKKSNEPSFKSTDVKQSTETESKKDKPSASAKKKRCDICGYSNHETDRCSWYRHCHESVEEAKEDYLAAQAQKSDKESADASVSDKRKREAGSDSDREADASKPKLVPTRGTSEPSHPNKSPYRINMIKSKWWDPSKRTKSEEPNMTNIIKSNISENDTLGHDMAADVGAIPEYQSNKIINKFNNKYLNKYSELRGSVKPICCSTNNYSDKLKDDNYTETIEFGDFKPAAIERDYGQQEPAAIERDYGQQDSTEGLDPGVPKNGVKPRSSPSCVI
jgi:hypothetical protein